ncbi:hypothetical protein KBC75_02865 [Candidatus Shapirobacteria bacterium]|nr:hypothetical protein [Candidatus Shapirobacteria bacterium]
MVAIKKFSHEVEVTQGDKKMPFSGDDNGNPSFEFFYLHGYNLPPGLRTVILRQKNPVIMFSGIARPKYTVDGKVIVEEAKIAILNDQTRVIFTDVVPPLEMLFTRSK